MKRKICHIGNSQGVSLPAEMLEQLHLSVGDTVEVKLDEAEPRIIVQPALRQSVPTDIDREFVAAVNDFVTRYGPALRRIAGR